MSPDQPHGSIELVHKQLRAALDEHLASLSHQYEEALATARFEVAAEADQAIADRVEAVRGEWAVKLEAEVAAARADAEQKVTAEFHKARTEAEREWSGRLEAEVLAARTETERRLLADALRARAEAEQEWAVKLETEINSARADAERRYVAESLKARMEAEQQAAETAARVRADLEKTLAAERQKLAETQAQLDALQQQLQQERQTIDVLQQQLQQERQTIEAFAQERQQLQSQIETARTTAQADAQAERQRMAGEIESHRLRLEAVQEQLRKAEADAEAERRRAASEREEAARDASSRLDALRAQGATQLAQAARQAADQLEDATRQAAEQLSAARREAADQIEAVRRETAEQLETLRRQVSTAQQAVPADNGQALAGMDRVLGGVRAIDDARSLSETFDALLRHASAVASRGALFLIDGDRLRSWKSIGFPQLEAQPFESASAGSGLLAQAVQTGEAVASGPAQPPPTFAAVPANRSGIAVPLLVGGRPVAVLYADDGAAGDTAPGASWRQAVEALACHTSTMLSLLTAMRTAQIGGAAHGGNGETDEQGARRYARLLVSEIKLYNEAAVRAGRERRDLLDRLRPEI